MNLGYTSFPNLKQLTNNFVHTKLNLKHKP